MPILDAINPYILYLKIGAVIIAVAAIVSAGFYVRHVFNDRSALQIQNGVLSANLIAEQQKVQVALEQLRIWQDTVKKMNTAIKNIKIQSDTYITGVENEKPPVVSTGNPIVFIPAGMPKTLPADSDMPGFKNYSAGRISPNSSKS